MSKFGLKGPRNRRLALLETSKMSWTTTSEKKHLLIIILAISNLGNRKGNFLLQATNPNNRPWITLVLSTLRVGVKASLADVIPELNTNFF